MIWEAAMVLVCSVLFIGMGLSGEIQRILGISWRILNCPKCLTFWMTLTTMVIGKRPALPSIALSFISSYAAMWLTLTLDALAVKYNSLYEEITENPDTSKGGGQEDTAAGADSVEADTHDEVS